MRPLDRLPSIKLKLGTVIVAAVGVSVVVVVVGVRLGVPLILLAAIAGSLALAMVQFLARGMTSPLRAMASAASAMAKGDYSQRVSATSRDEVGELARAFNRMADELAEIDRMRRDLIANASHELRTPISALQAVLENIVDGVAPADEDTLRTMLAQVERLGRLVGQLLDLSRLEAGAVPLHKQRFALRPLVERTVRQTRLRHDDVAITIDISSEIAVEGDAERVQQVIANIVDNAVRHSPPGGRVRIAARANGGVRLEVTDEGPGIAEHERERVFERFYRADSARTTEGSGLGLAIARWIVELHDGDIKAEAREPHGCRMVVTLPGAGI